jgi:hypothetical protein
LKAKIRPRTLVGAVAFVTLMILEVALSISLFHRPMGEYLADGISDEQLALIAGKIR